MKAYTTAMFTRDALLAQVVLFLVCFIAAIGVSWETFVPSIAYVVIRIGWILIRYFFIPED